MKVMGDASTQDWKRLGDQVVARRAELRMKQEDVSAAGGPTVSTLRKIEKAKEQSYRLHVLQNLERILHWRPGSVEAVLAGGDPMPEEQIHEPLSHGVDVDSLTVQELVEHIAAENPLLAELLRDKALEYRARLTQTRNQRNKPLQSDTFNDAIERRQSR